MHTLVQSSTYPWRSLCWDSSHTGHPLFSQSLAGGPVTTENFNIIGSPVSRQEANIAIGNRFALLVKASLALTVSTSHTGILEIGQMAGLGNTLI